MRTLLLSLFLTIFLNNPFMFGQNDCSTILSQGGIDYPPVQNGNPHMAACIAGLEKHLARGISVRGLDLLNYFRSGFPQCPTDILGYCPAKYAEMINKIADLNAGYILHAANFWGNEHRFSQEDYRIAVTQLVEDINNAYDCRNQRRPLIQANIWEAVNPSTIKAWPPPLSLQSQIGEVTSEGITLTGPGALLEANLISTEVMVEFYSEMTGAEQNYYFTNGLISNPKTNLYYSLENIVTLPDNTPNITKIEGSMWFYEQARFFIDAGFNSLHMGQSNLWGFVDSPPGTANGNGVGGNLQKMTVLIDKIRAYADTKQFLNYPPGGSTAKGIIITHEAFGGDLYRNNNSNDVLLFDHNKYPYRGNEIDPNNQTQSEIDFLAEATNCAGQNNSLLELFPFYRLPPIEDNFPRWDLPGTKKSSRACPVASGNRPFTIYMDNGGCTEGTVGELTKNGGALWGYDDKAWFMNDLDEECKADWMKYQIKSAREQDNYGKTAFMEAFALSGNANCYDPWTFADGTDFMFDAIEEAWEVRTPVIQAPMFGGPNWNFKVSDASLDHTSIYSWYITTPQGTSFPVKFSSENNILLSNNGWHTITLRQDNVGIPTSENLYGTRSVSIQVYNWNFGGFKVKADDPNYILLKDKMAVSRPATTKEIRNIELYSLNGQTDGFEKPTSPIAISLKEISINGLDISVAPNPAINDFSITATIPESGQLRISLINTLGQHVKEIVNEKIVNQGKYVYQSNLSNLPPGAYLVLLEHNNEVKTQKVFKQ